MATAGKVGRQIERGGKLFTRNQGTWVQLTKQKRMAMDILDAGRRKVWLDPTKTETIKKANTRMLIPVNRIF